MRHKIVQGNKKIGASTRKGLGTGKRKGQYETVVETKNLWNSVLEGGEGRGKKTDNVYAKRKKDQ